MVRVAVDLIDSLLLLFDGFQPRRRHRLLRVTQVGLQMSNLYWEKAVLGSSESMLSD